MARYIFTMYDAFYVNHILAHKIMRHISTKMQIADEQCVTTFLAVAGNFITTRGVQLIDNDNNNK